MMIDGDERISTGDPNTDKRVAGRDRYKIRNFQN